jgi:hypothetical protein
MTVKELISFFENYYGEKYSGIFLDTMSAYLTGCSPRFRKAAAEVLVKRFSHSFGKSPCPAEIEKHMSEILDAIPKYPALPEHPSETDEERVSFIGLWEQYRWHSRSSKNKPREAQ